MKGGFIAIIGIVLFFVHTNAQNSDSTKHRKVVKNGRFYASWGYNTDWYTHSNLSINQPQLNNNYTWEHLPAHDRIGWNDLFHVAPTIPQYNYRLGYFFDEKQLWGIELSFDHTKYVVTQGENATMNGTFGGRKVDTSININQNTLYWQLNNGANWFDINIERKLPVIHTKDDKFVVYGLVKVGAGPNVPHVDDIIFGHQNVPHFQLGGMNTGVEALVRFTFFDCVYLEYSSKLVYAWYWGLKVYGGDASVNTGSAALNFGAYEMIANIGVSFHLHKRVGTNTAD